MRTAMSASFRAFCVTSTVVLFYCVLVPVAPRLLLLAA